MTTQDELPRVLRAAYLALHRRSEAAFAAHGATADQFVLLATLARGKALTQRELARRMPSDPSTVRAMLLLLQQRGWVARGSHPSDGRARTVSLTAAGKRKFHQLRRAGAEIRAQIFGSLPSGEADTLLRLLARVARALSGECMAIGESTFFPSQENQP